MPIGADLVLHETPEPEKTRRDGLLLGRVIERAARRWSAPLAIPLMDLRLEKIDLVTRIGIPGCQAEGFKFHAPMDEHDVHRLCNERQVSFCAASIGRSEALRYIGSLLDLIPIGMTIGPYSLTTHLMTDPIAATAMVGGGLTACDSDEVRLLWQCLRVAEAAVQDSVQRQIQNGAKAIIVCEPAACTAFFSPRQLKAGSDIFERCVMEPNLRIKRRLDEAGCDLIFHDCGELNDAMVREFALRLHPVMLSLGSSRRLWEDARLVPADVVLYGNLPTKSFYSDSAMPVAEVIRRTEELVSRMRMCGHPYIAGSECDVLFVPEAQDAIAAKVEAMMACAHRLALEEATP